MQFVRFRGILPSFVGAKPGPKFAQIEHFSNLIFSFFDAKCLPISDHFLRILKVVSSLFFWRYLIGKYAIF